MMKFGAFIAACLFAYSAHAATKMPDCTAIDSYPASMAHAQMKNADVMENDAFDFSKTKVERLASEKIGHDKRYNDDLYRQVHLVTFTQKTGETIQAVTVSDATRTECSMGNVDVYVVLRKLEK